MAYFKQTLFGGIAPAVDPTILSEEFGQTATNVELVSGKIEPAQTDSPVSSDLKTNTISSIFNYDPPNQDYITGYSSTKWLQFIDPTHVVYGPVPGDSLGRIYFTNPSYPRISWNSEILATQTHGGSAIDANALYPRRSYRLGVPAPSGSILLDTNMGTNPSTGNPWPSPDPNETIKEVSYAITYVTFDGREGPPLYSGLAGEHSRLESISVSHVRQRAAGAYTDGLSSAHHINKVRIYKSNTGSEDTQYQFLKEEVINTNQGSGPVYELDGEAHTTKMFTDPLNITLGEVLPSATWLGPPDDDDDLYPDGPLQGLVNVSQGVFAGFTGKRFCLSEAFLPHAWPIQYRITIERDIVAVSPTQGGVVVLTEGPPYLVAGTDPTAMAALKIDFAQPCINRDSVVNIDNMVFYASKEGLCAVAGGQGEVVTKGLITPKQWYTDYEPEDYKAFLYEGKYVAFWSEGQNCKGFIYDPDSKTARLTKIDRNNETVLAGYTEASTGDLFLAKSGSTNATVGNFRKNIYNVDSAVFRTKVVRLPKPGSMSWLSVDAGFPFTAKVYADGVNVAHYYFFKSGDDIMQRVTVPSGVSGDHQVYNTTVRLPAVVATEWEVEVSNSGGALTSREGYIHEICISETLEELKAT